MSHQLVLILDFGSQYTQLIARRIRGFNVYCEIVPFNHDFDDILQRNPAAIVFSGSPASLTRNDAPLPDPRIWDIDAPKLCICYGMQLACRHFGGEVVRAERKEYGFAQIQIDDHSDLFSGLEAAEAVWMSHGDAVRTLPEGFERIAFTSNSPYAAIRDVDRKIWALQFHPEVTNTTHGEKIIGNFLLRVAGLRQDWTPASFIDETIKSLRGTIGSERVILGLSGGVDSSVAAALLHKAIGNQLVPILVDTGLLRYNEAAGVDQAFRDAFDMHLDIVDAGDIFLKRLSGVTDPEQKRKIIGHTFIEIFEKEASRFPDASFLAQGTLYPDVIESVSFKGPSATIKSHHNVGGLPERMNLRLVEPLRELFKDEVRAIGRELGLPELLVGRHPFPGPGLAIRIPGVITPERVKLLQRADRIFIDELHQSGLYDATWQAFAVLLPVQSVGVMGDERTYQSVCAIRAVNSSDGMTADWTRFPHDFLSRLANRIINEVEGINRVVYDISSKPPATIEWE